MPQERCLIWQGRFVVDMKQTGYVTEIVNGRMKVRVDRESACGGNCVSCKGCPTDAVIIECNEAVGISKGDTVELEMPDKQFFKGAMLGYGVPVILMIVGAVCGFIMAENDAASILGAVIGLAVGLLVAKAFTRKGKELVPTVKKPESNK